MLALLLALLAADPSPAPVLRIQASEPGTELSVKADAPGWSGACPAPVTTARPCEIAPAPRGQTVDLHVSGTRAFDHTVLLAGESTTVRIEHRGHDKAAAGVVLVLGAIGVIAAGVGTMRGGQLTSNGQVLVGVGAALEASGLILILNDLTGTHDRAVVVTPP